MTIPIRPGPWSFLQTLGEGVGNYVGNKNKKEAADRAEATKMLDFIFKAAQGPDKAFKAELLTSPTTLDLMKRAGFDKLMESNLSGNLAPQPEEAVRGQQSAYFNTLFSDPNAQPEERSLALATGKPPTKDEVLTERGKTLIGGIRNKRLEGDLSEPVAATVSGVPSAPSAAASVQTTQNPELAGIAKRTVTDLYTKLGRLPTPAEAVEAVKKDMRAKPFANELTEPFLGDAIRNLQADLTEEETKRIAAQTRRDTNSQNVVKDVQTQQSEIRQRIGDRSTENSKLRDALSPFSKIPGVTPDQLTESDRLNLAKIAANEAANSKDQETLTGLNQQAAQVIGPRVTAAGGAPEGTLAEKRNEWDRRSKAIKARPNDPRVKGKTVESLIGPRP